MCVAVEALEAQLSSLQQKLQTLEGAGDLGDHSHQTLKVESLPEAKDKIKDFAGANLFKVVDKYRPHGLNMCW